MRLFVRALQTAVFTAMASAVLTACGGGSADSPVIDPFYPEASAEWQRDLE